MSTQSLKPTKASLLKLFVVDNEGEYAGEYAVDSDCTVEFNDCLKAMGNTAMEDMQTVFMGELSATMLQGTNFNLVAISKGPLGSQEITWAKATLTTAEAVLSQAPEEEKKAAVVDNGLVSELKAVKSKLSEMESKLEVERSRAEQEIRFLKDQVAQMQSGAGQLEQTQKMLAAAAEREQQLRREMQSKQESVQGIEAAIASAREREEQMRGQYEAAKVEMESLRTSMGSVEQVKRELEARTKIINQKAMELLEREDKVRRREQGAPGILVR